MNRRLSTRIQALLLISAIVSFGSAGVRKRRQDAFSYYSALSAAGINIGPFTPIAHGCKSGDITIIDEQTIEIPNHWYDGKGPAAYFVLGNSGQYTQERVDLRPVTVVLPEGHSCGILPAYNGHTVRLKLPRGHRVQDFRFLAQYCLEFNHNFCYVSIPQGITPPPPALESDAEICNPPYLDNAVGKVAGGLTEPFLFTIFLLPFRYFFE